MLIPSQMWESDLEIDKLQVKNNFLDIQKDIAHYNIKIVAVTKYFGLDAIKAGYEAGIRDFGESRALDAIEKIKLLPKEVQDNSNFHFIGHLQSNKVEKVVRYFDVIHSIDTLKIAQLVSKASCSLNKREKVLLQVNNAGEEQKFGFSKASLKEVMGQIIELEGLDVIGLMNIAPLNAKESELRNLFNDMRVFRDELEDEFSISLKELSMGMSNDYKIAATEGATIIRIGRKLFK